MSISQPASDLPIPPPIVPERMLNSAQWGMASFLLSEVAFFCTLIATYVAFMGKDTVGPTPAQALSLPLVIATKAQELPVGLRPDQIVVQKFDED